jgi:hypothetical protein
MAYTGYHPTPRDCRSTPRTHVVGGVVDAVDAESGNKVYQEEEAKGLADPNHQRSIDGAQVGP